MVSEIVLARAKLAKGLRIGGAKEGVGRALHGERGRHTRQTRRAQALDLADPGQERRVIGIDGARETGIGEGVFMAAADQRLAGKGRELREAREHLRRRALEQAAAAERKQGVAAGEDSAIGEEPGDMAARVARCRDHPPACRPERHLLPLVEGIIEPWQAMGIGAGAGDRAAEARAQRLGRGDVVGMVMGEQNEVEPPAARLDRGDQRIGFGGIDEGERAGAAVPQQPGVIVLEDGA